jgi:hypothetical protein
VFVQISESHTGRAIRTERWKYSVRAASDVRPEPPDAETYVEDFLYDLQADPYEQTNLIHEPGLRAVADYLRGRLLDRMVAAGESRPTIIEAARGE